MESFWVQTAIGAIHAISFVCDVISFPVYLILQKPWKRRQLAKHVKVSDANVNNGGIFEVFTNMWPQYICFRWSLSHRLF